MGRPLTVSRAGRFTKRMNFVEELRASMPVSQYIAMLHEGALTGRFPKFDRYGNRLPDDQQPADALDEVDRGKLIAYLVDKSMPTYRTVEAPQATSAGDTADFASQDSTDADFTLLSSDQLREIASAASRLADAADGDQPAGGEARLDPRLASPESVARPAES